MLFDANGATNVKKFWRVLKEKSKFNKNSDEIPTLLYNGVEFTTVLEKINCLNNHFTSNNVNTSGHLKPIEIGYFGPKPTVDAGFINLPGFSNFLISEFDICKIISTLDLNKATGPDGIPNIIIKSCADALCTPLAIIFRASLERGIFPKKWKTANVTPIFKKKGDRTDPCNYRPISVLCNFSKIMERLVNDHLLNYLEQFELLNSNNSGFKKGDSATSQLLYITNKIQRGFEDNLDSMVVFLDVKAAFDRVWHEGLIYKLSCLGVKGQMLSWISNYLQDRSQKVVHKGLSSETCNITAGVPQGSILGPLLFKIFVNDFGHDIESESILFADDSTLMHQYKKVLMLMRLML